MKPDSDHRNILRLPPPELARVLNLDANTGFSSGERAFLKSSLGPGFFAAVHVKKVHLPMGWCSMSEVDLDAGLRKEIEQWLSALSATSCGPWAFKTCGVANPFHNIRPTDDYTAWMPLAPWQSHATAELLAPGSDCYQTICGSIRTYDVFDANSQLLMTYKASLQRDRIALLRRSWIERLKRLGMDIFFGVERNVDTGFIGRLDALHSLHLSTHIANRESEFPIWMDVQKEIAAMNDGEGQTCIVRAQGRLLERLEKGALSIPYFSLVFARVKKVNVFRVLQSANDCSGSDLACKLTAFYLGAWWDLFAKAGVIHLMPHAQNASVVIDRDGRMVGISMKDLRDAEIVNRYDALTHRSVRLHAVCKQYLAFEMLAHPIYYDATGGRLGLAEQVFSFAFQMLRNHVVRGLAASLDGAVERMALGQAFTRMIEVLADGGSTADLVDSRLPATASRLADRALRTRFARLWREVCA